MHCHNFYKSASFKSADVGKDILFLKEDAIDIFLYFTVSKYRISTTIIVCKSKYKQVGQVSMGCCNVVNIIPPIYCTCLLDSSGIQICMTKFLKILHYWTMDH